MLVSVEELTNYMDVKLSPKATLAANYVLEGLQNELEQYLGRPIEVATFSESYRILDDSTISYLPFHSNSQTGSAQAPPWRTIGLRNSPVSSVISVYVSRSGSASVGLELGTGYGVRKFGIDVWNPVVEDEFTVTYVAGLDPDKYKVLRLMILRAASREMQNMHDDNAGVQNLEARQATISQTGFLESELRGVRRLRRQRI